MRWKERKVMLKNQIEIREKINNTFHWFTQLFNFTKSIPIISNKVVFVVYICIIIGLKKSFLKSDVVIIHAFKHYINILKPCVHCIVVRITFS